MQSGNPILLKRSNRQPLLIILAICVAAAAGIGTYFYQRYRAISGHFIQLREYWQDADAHSDWALNALERCGEAPFIAPSDGFVAFFYNDFYHNGKRHQGVDIFAKSGPAGVGETPVFAAYDGFLTRKSDWVSSVIIRIPQDPLQPDRQIWTYYTHMADKDGVSFIDAAFPAGSYEIFVPAGTLLGYQGNYSADPLNPTGLHLHFSIVLDDGNGQFRNELEFSNTLDPSPYLGIELNGTRIGDRIATCSNAPYQP